MVFDAAHLPETESFAVSTGSRDIAESEVAERMERFLSVFDTQDGIAFKKIDSLLRGHVAAEIAHLVRRSDFHSAVIAPAFPALDRITRNGRQWAKLAGDDRHRMVGPDLRSDFARFGMDLRLGLPDDAQGGSPQVFMADAQTDGDLNAIVDSCRRAGRLLWCGSAGLADCLAGSRRGPVGLAAKRMLVICGTRHPVASLQLERLGAKDRSGVRSIQPGYDAENTAEFVNNRLRSGKWAAALGEFSTNAPRRGAGKLCQPCEENSSKARSAGRLVRDGWRHASTELRCARRSGTHGARPVDAWYSVVRIPRWRLEGADGRLEIWRVRLRGNCMRCPRYG